MIQNGYFGVLIDFEDVAVAEFILILTNEDGDVEGELLDFFLSGAEPLLKSVCLLTLDETDKWIFLITRDDLLVENHDLIEAFLIIMSNHFFLLLMNS